MDPAVEAAFVVGGWTAFATLGTQFLAGRREAARDKLETEREERSQRWDTNRERLIELRALLDQSGVTLMACDKAVEDLRTAVAMRDHVEIEVPPDKVKRPGSLERELDELDGRLALRLGTTHPVTRSFTLARHSLSDCYMRLRAALFEDPERDPIERSNELGQVLDKSQHDARKYRQQFFERARALVGVQDPLLDDSAEAPQASGSRAAS